jgi:hypothetical protein
MAPYDTKECHAILKRKAPSQRSLHGHPRNEAVKALKAGELKEWKRTSGYPSAFKSRDRDVSFQTTHQLEIELEELQCSDR